MGKARNPFLLAWSPREERCSSLRICFLVTFARIACEVTCYHIIISRAITPLSSEVQVIQNVLVDAAADATRA